MIRTTSTTRTMALLASALVGCVAPLPGAPDAGSGGGGGGGETPRTLFNSTVVPLVERCANCHVGPETTSTDMFLGSASTPDSFYEGITNDRRINGGFDPASAEILTKGAHDGVEWWSTAAVQTISNWLTAEADARGPLGSGGDVVGPDAGTGGSGGGGVVGNTDPVVAMQEWASCLAVSQTEYQSTKVYEIANMISSQGTCYSCHEPGGAGGAYWGIANNYQTMLTKWEQKVFITAPFELETVATSPVTYKMISGREKICNKGTEQDHNGGTHPSFDCEQTVGGVKPVDALDTFTADVQANEDLGKCPAPGMFAPPS